MAYEWTDEAIETLRTMWDAGATGDEIAIAIGAPTRNTVTGKVHRLGMGGRRRVSRQRRMSGAAPGVVVRIERAASPQQLVEVAADIKAAAADGLAAASPVAPPAALRPITIMGLGPQMCRWPIGTPRTPGFGFCGRRVTDESGVPTFGRSYCAVHAAMAFGRGTPSERAADKIHGSVA